uniref:Elongation of very long chain fatty acids protein n=1 Tax=Sphaeramia orbicularis TaxID=375764 RepID=A0A672YFX4_9TELE
MNESLALREYDFERRFDERRALEWMQENWSKSFMFCGLYARRPKLNLRRPLVLWSLSLAIFSIIGAFRTDCTCYTSSQPAASDSPVCDISFYSAPVSKFWAYAFVLSKAPELGDTVFIVLRKQHQVAGGGWFMTMNYVVHSFMYTYYAARAAGLRVPRPCAMIITATQIMQMVMGLAVLGLVYHWMHEVRCPSYMDNIAWGSLMYLSYLILFALFFYNSYLKGSSGDKGKIRL